MLAGVGYLRLCMNIVYCTALLQRFVFMSFEMVRCSVCDVLWFLCFYVLRCCGVCVLRFCVLGFFCGLNVGAVWFV